MKIVQAPHPALSAKAKPVKKITKEVKQLIEGMKQTLIEASDPEGVGLAAPQVGKSLQIFVTKPNKRSPFGVFINPKVTPVLEDIKPDGHVKKKKIDSVQLEGCLSLKDIWGNVRRVKKVTVEYMDENGVRQTKIEGGFMATILQHEYDHLQGILFPKRVLEQKGKLYHSSKDANNEDVFEEIEI